MKIKKIIIFANLIFFFYLFNSQILGKEQLLKEGKLVLLELAPVDPRSLMQGDYMRLNYAIVNDIRWDSIVPPRGYLMIKLDEKGIAKSLRIQKDIASANSDEIPVFYYHSDWSVNIGAESYFFQEGNADKFAKAKYGGIRVDKNGDNVLIGLFDEKLQLIKP